MPSTPDLIKMATDLATVPQHELAAEVGVSPLTLSHWRSGKRNPTPRNMMELGRVLLEHSRGLQLAAHEIMRVAHQDDSRDKNARGESVDRATLELFGPQDEAA